MLCLVCVTYVANVWPVTSVCSQNAVQHVMIWPALMINKEIMMTMEQTGQKYTLIHTHPFPEGSVIDLL